MENPVTIEDKNKEYDLMSNSVKRTIEVQIPNGPKTVWPNTWYVNKGLTSTVLKTTTKQKFEHIQIKFVKVDLNPIRNIIMYIVTINHNPDPKPKKKK